MTLLFVVFVLLGFGAMLLATVPALNCPTWLAWLFWFVAALIWAVPQLR